MCVCGHKLRLIIFNILLQRELYIVVIKKGKKNDCNIFHATWKRIKIRTQNTHKAAHYCKMYFRHH